LDFFSRKVCKIRFPATKNISGRNALKLLRKFCDKFLDLQIL
jgi:hypothetical protein